LEKDENKKEKEEEEVFSIPPELKMLERSISYFILALYSYFDVYTKYLIRDVTSVYDVDQFYKLFDNMRFSNPNETLKEFLSKIKDNNVSLNSKVREKLEKYSWQIYQNESVLLSNIRNKVAHRDPIIDIDIILNEFGNLKRRIDERAKNLQKSMKIDPGFEFVENIISFLMNGFKNIFLVQEIGNSLYRYLLIVDHVVYNYLESCEKNEKEKLIKKYGEDPFVDD
jgi:hypothetical protein